MLNVMALFLSLMKLLVQVMLLESKLVLNKMSGISEDNDAADLNSEVAPDAGSVSSEEGDGGGDHVGTEECGGVDHELLGVIGTVPSEHESGGGLEEELSPGLGVV